MDDHCSCFAPSARASPENRLTLGAYYQCPHAPTVSDVHSGLSLLAVISLRNPWARDAQRDDSKSTAPMLISLPYGTLVETPLDRNKPIGNEAQPGATSFNRCISLHTPWARRYQRITPLAPEHLFTLSVLFWGEEHGLEPSFRPFLGRDKEEVFHHDHTQSAIV